MVNVGFGFGSLLGLLDLLLAILYLVASIALLIRTSNSDRRNLAIFYILQLLFTPLPLLLAGAILFFQGWRLDPILQFALLMLHSPVIFSLAKDALILRNR